MKQQRGWSVRSEQTIWRRHRGEVRETLKKKMSAKDATKDATMSVKNATIRAKNATMTAKDATMSAKQRL